MRRKKSALIAMVIAIATLLCGNVANAQTMGLATCQTIYVTVHIEKRLSLNLEDEWLAQNLKRPEAEAFSELKEKGICVEKFQRDNHIVWRFTKTE